MKNTEHIEKRWNERGPLIVANFLDEARCKQYIEQFNKLIPKPRSFQGVVNLTLRKCDFVVLTENDYEVDFQRFIELYMEPFFGTPISKKLSYSPLVFHYPVGVGFTVHHDLVTPIEIERGKYNAQPVVGGDFTIVIFLNDSSEYEGGELYFPNHSVSTKPVCGTAVAFPATEDFIHGVNPILDGERYTAMARVYTYIE